MILRSGSTSRISHCSKPVANHYPDLCKNETDTKQCFILLVMSVGDPGCIQYTTACGCKLFCDFSKPHRFSERDDVMYCGFASTIINLRSSTRRGGLGSIYTASNRPLLIMPKPYPHPHSHARRNAQLQLQQMRGSLRRTKYLPATSSHQSALSHVSWSKLCNVT